MRPSAHRVFRSITNALGINLLRLFAFVTMAFLALFIILIVSSGGDAFFRDYVRNYSVENVRIKGVTLKNAIGINGKYRDVYIENGTVTKGTLRKGVARDILIEGDAISSLIIRAMTIESCEIHSGIVVNDNGEGYAFDENGILIHGAVQIDEAVIAGARIAPLTTKTFGETEIILGTNIHIAEGTFSAESVSKGLLFDLSVPKAFRHRMPSLQFLTTGPADGMTSGGILPAILGTVYLTLLALLIALPLGVLAAIFLHEYGKPPRLIAAIRTAINTLAGVPSVVFGLFGYVMFVNFFGWNASILSGGATLAILILPIIINASEEALKTVPYEFREAAYGLGATKRQTILSVVLPTALPNILTGAIISVGRAAGETAPILFTAAAFYTIGAPASIFEECMALPYQIYALMTEGTAPVQQTIAYGTAITLLALVLLLNTSAMIVRYALRKKRKW